MEMEALKWMLGVLQLLISAFCAMLYGDIKANKAAVEKQAEELKLSNEKHAKGLAEHKLHMAENYATKSESTRAFDALTKSVESLVSLVNGRFDKMDEKLDKKVDKGV